MKVAVIEVSREEERSATQEVPCVAWLLLLLLCRSRRYKYLNNLLSFSSFTTYYRLVFTGNSSFWAPGCSSMSCLPLATSFEEKRTPERQLHTRKADSNHLVLLLPQASLNFPPFLHTVIIGLQLTPPKFSSPL